MTSVRRRKLLALGGTVLSAGVAGCFGSSGGDDPPSTEENTHEYAQFLPGKESGLSFTLLRLDGMDSLLEFLESDAVPDSLPDGSVLESTVKEASETWLAEHLALAIYGLDIFLTDDEPTATEIEWILLSDSGIILSGTVDRDELRERLETKQETELADPVALTETDTRGAYTVYSRSDTDANVCVSDEEVIISSGDTALDVAVGDRQSVHQAYPPFRWLVREAGDGDIVNGLYKPAIDLEDEQSGQRIAFQERLVRAATFTGDAVTLDMAGAFGDIPADIRRGAVEKLREDKSSFRPDAEATTDESVTVTSNGLVVSMTYDWSR